MKNKLIDLNNHLFAQLEKLSDEELKPDELAQEITRTDAIVKISEQLIGNANLVLRGAALVAEYGGKPDAMLAALVDGPREITQQGKK